MNWVNYLLGTDWKLACIAIAWSIPVSDQLTKDVDLTGVEIIEKDQKLIHQARIEVEKQAESMLRKGLEALNQSQVETRLF